MPREFIILYQISLSLHRILKWVYADYENRVPLCKTGWKSWSKYSDLKVETYYDKVMKSNYTCLKCGKRMNNNSTVKVLKFIINKPNYVYLHKHCIKFEGMVKTMPLNFSFIQDKFFVLYLQARYLYHIFLLVCP